MDLVLRAPIWINEGAREAAMKRSMWALMILIPLGASAQEGRHHYLVGPGVHGFESGFADPRTGRPGQWVGESTVAGVQAPA